MAHRGQRSNEGLAKRHARRFCLTTAYIDRERGEIICLVEQTQILHAVRAKFPDALDVVIPSVFKGLVLADGYGSGAFQPKCPLVDGQKTTL